MCDNTDFLIPSQTKGGIADTDTDFSVAEKSLKI